MNRNEVFSHFKSILDDMIAHSLWFKTYIQSPRYMEDTIYGSKKCGIPSNVEIHTGATRACIVDKNYDWVVKFDIDEDRHGSACQREEDSYRRACDRKLGKYFAEVEYLGTYYAEYKFFDGYDVEDYVDLSGYWVDSFNRSFFRNRNKLGSLRTIVVSIPLYGYKKVKFEIEYAGQVSKEEADLIKSYRSPLSVKNYSAAASFLRKYGVNEYQILSDFLIEEDINDLHPENAGFLNGNFIILDYAGYFDPDECDSYDEEDE